MAPEIVRGEAKPSNLTDLYSLGVLLFYLFHLGHPCRAKGC
jgi:serine/threonine protein kinase